MFYGVVLKASRVRQGITLVVAEACGNVAACVCVYVCVWGGCGMPGLDSAVPSRCHVGAAEACGDVATGEYAAGGYAGYAGGSTSTTARASGERPGYGGEGAIAGSYGGGTAGSGPASMTWTTRFELASW